MTAEDESVAQSKPYCEGDVALATLVAAVSRNDADLGVTLTVAGGQITGQLVGVNRYWREVDGFARENGNAGVLTETMREMFTLPDEAEHEEDEDFTWTYIHLVDARYVTQTGQWPANGMLWRGRLELVAGWSLGRMLLKSDA